MPNAHPHNRTRAAAAVAAFALGTAVASAQSFNVTLNGSPVVLNPGPQERAGRVFVPLRGVFEQLGASVVYQNGVINAQGRNHAVSLHIGSTQATVDGQAQTLDVAPFIVGASTYVPLRFVSQALGATVNYDAANRIVALTANGGPPPQPPQQSALTLRSVHPAPGSTVDARRPAIEAQFAGAQADPNTIRVSIDGLNVTDQSSRAPDGIVYSPPSDLLSQRHDVRVAGRDQNGAPFERSWTFTSGTQSVQNTIDGLRPADGDTVARQFAVRGRTLPNARVVVQVGTVGQGSPRDVLGQILGVGGSSASVRSEVIAGGDGSFVAPISLNVPSGTQIRLVVDSTDARTETAAPRLVRNLTVQ